MFDIFSRTSLVLGKNAVEILKKSSVAVFGLGGVGSYTVSALARCGVGEISIFDNDIINVTNINRQLIALNSTVGMDKVDVMEKHIKDINPNTVVNKFKVFYNSDNADEFDMKKYSYVADAIDTVTSKLLIIENCKKANIPVISSMGTGNKINPADFTVCDIYETKVCPLAKVMRRELKKRNIESLKVVYSKEVPITPKDAEERETKGNTGRFAPGSVSFVPPVAGFILASEIIKDLIKEI